MPKLSPRSIALSPLGGCSHGFILLEVLVAMGLVAGSWVALGNTYQFLILRLGQLQEQRSQIKQALDQHEIAIFSVAQSNNTNPSPRKLVNESIGVPRRSRAIPDSGGTSDKK
ncbi:hypothetical protein ICN42_03815 [Polynucleobacter sp. 71A-WALBACH]|uniref:type II secretion system protein n=1 Tax=Polynucleobacter sp. 71A-WALBACH TaxID=2689097 RepID=UPI001C0DA1C3|nr:hypothetical protein [Polynucleobacter sp. 71A-WALBACH]MBU3593220.1 hypothetical protein [Polynucleobacter sp. 71A-WALBACH]